MATILCRLSEPRLMSARTILGGDHQLKLAEDWGQMRRFLTLRLVDLVLADPYANGHALSDIVRLREHFPNVAVAAFLPPNNEALTTIEPWKRSGVTLTILDNLSDTGTRLTEAVRVRPSPIRDALMESIRPRVEQFPRIRTAIDMLFRTPERFFDVECLTKAFNLDRRRFDEQLVKARLGTGHRLVLAARLGAVYEYLQNPDLSATTAARLLGYSDLKVLNGQSRRIFGLPVNAWRRSLSSAEVVERLTDLCCLRYPRTESRGPLVAPPSRS